MDIRLTPEDKERIKLLEMVSNKGLNLLTLKQLNRLQLLVEKKDYSHNKKANKSKTKLLSKINAAIYELEEKLKTR